MYDSLIFEPLFNLFLWAMELSAMDMGIGIILLTIAVRGILYIPMHKSMMHSKTMQELQPEIKKLKDECGGDQQQVAMKTMALYKEHGVNPFGSCLPVLLQIPILFGVFGVLRLDFNLPETMSYAYEKFAGFDVTALKTDFFGFEVPTMVSEAVSAGDYSYVILPVLVGVSQYYALKLAMKKNHEKVLDITPDESKEPDKMKEMEKMSGMMTKFLPVFVGVMSYTFQAGLSIYWISSTVFGIFQQIAINKSWERRKKGLDVASGGRSAVKAEVVDVGGSKKEKMGDVNVEVIKLDK